MGQESRSRLGISFQPLNHTISRNLIRSNNHAGVHTNRYRKLQKKVSNIFLNKLHDHPLAANQASLRQKMKTNAWVTSAVDNGSVDKAIILAGSLRRSLTVNVLLVFTTLDVSKELRVKLKDAFDLVLFLEKKSPNGLSLEDYAKLQAFSLMAFKKCVYLSPTTLVLENCDEIFKMNATFAAAATAPKGRIAPSVYLFTPNLEMERNIEKMVHGKEGDLVDLSKYLETWLDKQDSKIETLDEKFHAILELKGHGPSMTCKASIVNFTETYPLEILDISTVKVGPMERLAVDYCWTIYKEDIEKSPQGVKGLISGMQYENEPIAVVGMSFRLPGGNNVDEFWSLLAEGRSGIVPVPSHRWNKDRSIISCKNRKIEAGFLNVPIDEIDAKFFGLNPKEAEFLDPQQRLLLEVTWEALEDGMIDPLKLRGTDTGVFVGSWVHDYKEISYQSTDVDFFRIYMGNSIASTAARISHFLETTGPSIATESGCSSGIAAVDMACKSLRNGDSSMAITAGVNLLLHPFDPSLMEYVLSPDYRCKTFDADANGFARAEACAVLLLKRLSDAVKDGDNMYGLIRGTALTQEGISKSYGTPTVHCESLAMELALRNAGVDPKDVSYLEAHGTGTSVGDPLEITAIQKTYSKGRTEPLLIGSVKTNVGHTESVSGITGIIKVLLSMKNELIPQHLNLKTLNPDINLDTIPAQIPLTPVSWPKNKGKRRIAAVSSFGISGTDGHAIIEEPPQFCRHQLDLEQERPLHVMKISAKSSESMDALIQKYLNIFNDKIDKNEDNERDFANTAYSANIGRGTFSNRAIFTARNFSDAAKILKEKTFKLSDVQSPGSSLCFLFTGQGSQYPNMAKQLYETSPVFKESFEKCEHLLQKRYSISIKNVLWSNSEANEKLSRTLYSQTSIFVVEYCLLKLWESWGVKPDYVMGHSLGEFAAAVAAGALDFEDAIKLVAERSCLIDNLHEGKMLVIKADKKTVDESVLEFQELIPNFWLDYAALNSPEQTVVAGDSENIEKFSKFCEQKSLKTISLAATHAFHSRHMDPMLDAYRAIASSIKKPKLGESLPKYISGMEGRLLDIELLDSEYWVRHTREKVRFTDACKTLQDEDCTLFVEVGPHPVLSALTMMNIEGHPVTCLPSIRRKEEEWVTILDSLSKLYLSSWKGEIDWKGFDKFYQRNRVKIPFYQFNSKPTWTQFEQRYAKIHPLIGSIMPTATNDTVFQNSLTLKNANFVQDHVIGNTAVFPGAGFLEMCLAAGHSTIQGLTEEMIKPRRPIIIKSLRITAPLALQDSGACKVQTVTCLNDSQKDDELEYSVGVYRHADTEEDIGNWIQHASAKFLPQKSAKSCHSFKPIDIASIQSSWEETDNNIKEFYERLREVGLRFGPKFQSLQRIWRSEKGLLALIKVPNDCKNYLIHPTVADAMLQGIIVWESKGKFEKKLKVPVQIGEFVWLKESVSLTQFLYCSTEENNVALCTLLDDTGSPLAQMKRVDFVETTASLVEALSSIKSSLMPKIWEEVWKPSRGPMQGYMTHETPIEEFDYSDDDLKYFAEKNNIPEEERAFCANLVQLARFSVLKALYILGWKPDMDHTFSVDYLLESLNIQENFRQYIQFFLRSMSKDNCLMLKILNEEETEFIFVVPPPTINEVEDGLKCVTDSSDYTREDYKLTVEIGKKLSKILTGEVVALDILFPEDTAKPSAKKFYETIGATAHQAIRPAISVTIKHCESAARSYATKPNATTCRPIYRILEVGAGTGASSQRYLHDIVTYVSKLCDIEYWFTDVSAAFFNSAEKYLEEYLQYIKFKKFDMEADPLEQGLCPGYFDTVAAIEVFHVAKDVKKTMKSIRSLVKPGGLFATYETISQDERYTFIFGLLKGYWQFEDREFRKFHTTLTPEMWKEALTDAGFYGVRTIPMGNNVHGVITAHAAPVENTFLVENLSQPRHSWLIFGEHDDFSIGLHCKLSNVNRKCFIIPRPEMADFTEKVMHDFFHSALATASENVEDIEGIIVLWPISSNTRDQRKISLPFLSLMKLVSELKTVPKTFAVTRGTCAIESSDVIDPAPGTLIGFCRSLLNENSHAIVTYMDLDPNIEILDQLDELFMNLWTGQKLGTAFRDGQRLSPKFTAGKIVKNMPLTLPNGCDRFQIALPKSKLISDLTFVDMDPISVENNQVEIQVKAIALNFKDVLTVLKPTPEFEELNSIGFDISGVVVKAGENVTRVKVGDRVVTMIQNRNISCPNFYVTEEKSVILLPDRITFAEGATLPAVFFTAIYCLLDRAKVKKGETILIHTASGGVGLAAIQICKKMGINIIATAGSNRKRTYLRNLGIQHVFHSRTTKFKEEILRVTEGLGVNVILNSLTGPGYKEATLDVLGKRGRFIEMSKLNVWSKEEVKELRSDVHYEIVDLTALKQHDCERLVSAVEKHMKDADFPINPIPYERFDVLNIRGALNYLQKAKHIGKIVCIMPEVTLEKSKLAVKTPLFNEFSTYIVTGGLGGIGFEIVKWMLENGAKHIVIMSRSAPRPEKCAQIKSWNKAGKHVEAFPIDVGHYEKCEQLLQELQKPESGFPQVRGVMHAAGVLHDGILENQSWGTFSETYNPKVDGTWNLHDLTKTYLLEHFVLFSSISALFGTPGQTNHSASNAFEDCLGAYRKSLGLPATCVNWGNWGEVGAATEMDIPGVRPISTTQGLLALEQLLRTQTSHLAVVNIDSFLLLQKFLPQTKHYVDDSRLLEEAKMAQIVNSDEFWQQVDSFEDREGKVNCFKTLVKTILRNILKLDPNEPIDDDANLQEIGVDSLMMLEMKNIMQNVLASRMALTASQIKDCKNIEMLANTLVDILMGEHGTENNHLSHEELKQLIRDDSKLLSEFIFQDNLICKPINQVETVLLTGVTGNLGPYLLRELTERSQVKKVWCLIRPTNKPLERLTRRLKDVEIIDLIDMEKVEVVEGDITAPEFGLPKDAYIELCENVDAVVHSAVKSDHLSEYWNAPEEIKSHVRTVNVLGTKNLLQFAGERKVKQFYHASAITIYTGVGKGAKFSEGWQDVSALDNISSIGSMGYIVSKHIAEQLVYQATLKGIPCKSFRFPLIAGESKSGRIDYASNHAILRWLTCMKIGAIHDLPAPILTIPVDICAKLSLDIFFNPDAPTDVFNIVQKHVEVEQVLVEVAEKFGIKMEILTHQQFIERLKANLENSPAAAFINLYVEGESDVDRMLENQPPAFKKYLEDGVSYVDVSKLEKYAPYYSDVIEKASDVMMRDFNYLKCQGVFEKHKINQ